MGRTVMPGCAVISSLALLLLLLPPQLAAAAAEATATTTLDLTGQTAGGQRYDGIGIIADATTKLLYSYEEPYRSQLVEYFFKPQFAASLDILKVEVAGDGQQTLGTSSSHQHTKDEKPNFTRGMLWWLMRSAKALNPSVIFYGLPWTYPGWVQSPYSAAAAEYLATWLDGARALNLSVSYIGLAQNERPACGPSERPTCASIVQKRQVFDAHGHKDVKIVAPDAFDFTRTAKGDSQMLLSNPAANAAVAVLGVHGAAPLNELYGPVQDWMTNGERPLWNSENEAGYMGVRFLGRAIVRAYVETNATGFIEWPITNGAYDHLPFMDNILPSHATQPWSGHYNMSTHIWCFAHHTQFSSPGWRFDRANSKFLRGGGSVVTKRSSDGKWFTSVIETVPCEDMPVGPHDDVRVTPQNCYNMSALPQAVVLKLPAGVMGSKVAVWISDVRSDVNHSLWFNRQADQALHADGTVMLHVPPSRLITVTNQLNKGYKGSHPLPPPAAPFPLPFKVNFSETAAGTKYSSVPQYFLDQRGVFEVTTRAPYGVVLRQQAPQPEVVWIPGPSEPVTIVGDWTWTQYNVTAVVMLLDMGPAAQPVVAAAAAAAAAPAASAPAAAAAAAAAEGHHVAPPQCNASEFKHPMSGGNCNGLAKMSAGDASVDACIASCCRQSGCNVWQYENVSAKSPLPAAGCWVGPTCKLSSRHGPWLGMSKHPAPPAPTPAAAHVSVGGLVSESGIAIGGNQPDSGIFLQLQHGGVWRLTKKVKGGAVELANGTVGAAAGGTTWIELSLSFQGGGKIVASIDGHQLASVTDTTNANGWAALGCSWGAECLYQSFTVTI